MEPSATFSLRRPLFEYILGAIDAGLSAGPILVGGAAGADPADVHVDPPVNAIMPGTCASPGTAPPLRSLPYASCSTMRVETGIAPRRIALVPASPERQIGHVAVQYLPCADCGNQSWSSSLGVTSPPNVRHTIMLRRHLSRASSKLLPSDTSLYNAMQAIIGQELRARYETPQEVPREMRQLLAHLDEQAGKESQALNEKQEPEHHAFHVDAAVEHESSVISIKRQAASDGPRGCTASVRTAGKFFSARRNQSAQSPLRLRTGSRPSIPRAHHGISI